MPVDNEDGDERFNTFFYLDGTQLGLNLYYNLEHRLEYSASLPEDLAKEQEAVAKRVFAVLSHKFPSLASIDPYELSDYILWAAGGGLVKNGTPVIIGPNTAGYDPSVVNDILAFIRDAKENEDI